MKIRAQILAMIFLLLALTACSRPSSAAAPTQPIDQSLVGTMVAMTLEAMYTPMPTPVSTLAYTPTAAGTATQTPTITPTYSLPTLSFNGNTNCRKGPGTVYDVVTVLRAGVKVEAVGRLEKTNYWLVKKPGGADTCWVADDFAQPSGSIQILPTVTAPPLPTPKPPTAPSWSTWSYSCEFASGGSNITMHLAWTNRSGDATGFTIYRDDKPVATLGPDATTYTDIAFVATGQSMSYKIEVQNNAGTASSSTISASCQ